MMLPSVHKTNDLHLDVRIGVVMEAVATRSGNPGRSGNATNSRTRNKAKIQSIL